MGKTVYICPLGDSLTEGDGNGSAYRYELFRRLYMDGADFAFVGGQKAGDIRLPERYARHAGYCGYVIGDDAGQPGSSLRAVLAQSGGNLVQQDVFVSTGGTDGGMTTAQAVKMADIILLYIGANDIHQKLDLPRFFERYMSLVDTLFAMNPTASVYAGVNRDYLGIRPEEGAPSLADQLLALDTQAYAHRTGHRLHMVDLCAGHIRIEAALGDVPVDDGHPRPAGNRKLAEAFAQAILPEVRALNDGPGVPLERIPATGLTHDLPVSLTLRPCESKTLHAAAVPENATVPTVLWSSNYPEVAEVDDYGVVTAHRAGTAQIFAATLDGRFQAGTLVFVKGRPLDRSAGMPEVFSDDFSDRSTWQVEPEAAIKPEYHEFYAYFREPNGQAVSRKSCVLGHTGWMEFVHMTANDKEHRNDFDGTYTEVCLGHVSVRFVGGGRYVHLTEHGRSLGCCEVLPPVSVHTPWGLQWDCKELTLYRGNEPMLTASLSVPPGGITTVAIRWHQSTLQDRLFDLRVYSKSGR